MHYSIGINGIQTYQCKEHRVMSCQSFNSYTPIMSPFLFNNDPKDADQSIPEFNPHVYNPCLPHQASCKDKKFDAFTTQNKHMVHLECCGTNAPFVLRLFCYIEESGMIWKMFRKFFMLQNLSQTTLVDKTACYFAKFPNSKLHSIIHHSIQLNSINGIINIEATAQI